jgi:anti-anti-sigma regulatory factor/nucleotide-binding universal stress UspA family protein
MIVETRGDVIKLKGALVENQWPAIKSAVSLLLAEHPRGVIIDAGGLTEISEPGAHTFLDASSFMQAHNSRIVVAGMPPDMLAEIRRIPGVRSQLVVAPSVDEARASLQAGGAAPIIGKKVRPSVLVPLVGRWHQATDFAATQAAHRRAELHLAYILQIPRNLPLGEPVPQMEREAQQALDEAEKALKRRGVTIRKLTPRAREIIEGIAKVADDTKPELVVIAYSKEEMTRSGSRCASIGTICSEVPGDIAVLCVGG